MIDRIQRSESLIALLPPAIALAWAIADATTGLVAADRAAVPAAPLAQFVSSETAAVTTAPQQGGTSVVVCSAPGAEIRELHFSTAQHAALQRLCRAGLKFTASLPKT